MSSRHPFIGEESGVHASNAPPAFKLCICLDLRSHPSLESPVRTKGTYFHKAPPTHTARGSCVLRHTPRSGSPPHSSCSSARTRPGLSRHEQLSRTRRYVCEEELAGHGDDRGGRSESRSLARSPAARLTGDDDRQRTQTTTDADYPLSALAITSTAHSVPIWLLARPRTQAVPSSPPLLLSWIPWPRRHPHLGSRASPPRQA
ncbi:hypothetical protein OH77DRAFT_1429664 [Trametes cingulata]|nr:hypothetical protein OH77DRAFT_1429664 [Trametes cingulata]